MKPNGYTLVELIVTIAAFAAIVLSGFLIYTAFHFIAKFW